LTVGMHGWAYSHSHLCSCCRPASGHTVRGVSERKPTINQLSHQVLLRISVYQLSVLNFQGDSMFSKPKLIFQGCQYLEIFFC